METIAVKFIISGRVQGVGFRWFVLNAAQQLAIKGTVRNNIDGTVEVIAQSDIDNIYQLKKIIEKGSAMSRVDNILQTDHSVNNQIKEFKVVS